MRDIDTIVIHHSASSADTTTEQIRAWHTASVPHGRGWSDIGYHIVIEGSGRIRQGRLFERDAQLIPGAHVLGHNTHTVGVCVVGFGPSWNEKQTRSLCFVAETLSVLFDASIRGHRDMQGAKTECPGLDVVELLTRFGVNCR